MRKLLEKKALSDPFLKEALDIKSRGDLGGKVLDRAVDSEEEVNRRPEEIGHGKDRGVESGPEEKAKSPEVGNLWAI